MASLFRIIANIKPSGADDAATTADFRAVRKFFHSMAEVCRILDEIERELPEAPGAAVRGGAAVGVKP
jgi:hypothetical protein